MSLTEPMTMLTDYALAGVTAWLAWQLHRDSAQQWVRRFWAAGFYALAVAAVAGGTHHGFAGHLSPGLSAATWKIAVYGAGIFSAAMLAGSVVAVTHGALRTSLLAFVGLKLAAYTAWVLARDEFGLVIADSGVAMAGLLALHGWSVAARRDAASSWVLAAVAISALAAAVQYSRFALHEYFNHNDLYHAIQIAAMTLFYKAGKLLRDSPPPRLSP